MAFLELRDLKKSYRSPEGEIQTVLDVEHFELGASEQVAIEGRSGSGKTTFLNLIAGILRPETGSVRLDGEEVSGLSEARRDAFRARNIGYVFQTFNLLGGYTALENVMLGMAFGPGIDRSFARALLVGLGLEDRLNHRPSQMSIGQQQRVALARALANRPRLVLADEPTGNLDPHHAGEALRLIRELCGEHEAALLLVSHDRDVLSSFDRVETFAELNRVAVL
ncbi:MAG: ABC transporter ATP-binding protein [bacterium]|nr:ABC transporter ATP-binding protein [bacterium]